MGIEPKHNFQLVPFVCVCVFFSLNLFVWLCVCALCWLTSFLWSNCRKREKKDEVNLNETCIIHTCPQHGGVLRGVFFSSLQLSLCYQEREWKGEEGIQTLAINQVHRHVSHIWTDITVFVHSVWLYTSLGVLSHNSPANATQNVEFWNL